MAHTPVKDGNLPYGLITPITILETGVVYVLNNFNWSQDSTVVEQRDGQGKPSGAVVVEGFVTGTADCQLATASTATPSIGDTFVYDSAGYIVTSVGKTMESMGIHKCNIGFRKSINPLVTNPSTDFSSGTSSAISLITMDAEPNCTSFEVSGLPTGITASGLLIGGTPTTIGNYTVTISATSPDNLTGQRQILWEIE